MKNIQNRILSILAGLAIASAMTLSANVTTLPWQSTSAMQATGSVHAAHVIAADAPGAKCMLLPMTSTSTMREIEEIATPDLESSELFRPKGPRKAFDLGGDTGKSDEYPIGEPWILLLFAAIAAGAVAYNRHREIVAENAQK